MSNKKRILFFTKDLNRTGAEIILFNIVESLDRNKFDIGIVLMQQGGDLVNNLPKDVQVFYLENTFNLFDKIRFHLGEDVMLNRLKKISNDFKADIWYINTITNAFVLKYYQEFTVYTFLHIHENLFGIGHLSLTDTEIILTNVDHYIACSDIIYNQLKAITDKPCTTITSCIDKDFIDSCLLTYAPTSNKKIKIVGSGTICQVKGVEIFVELSKLFDSAQYEFVWIGKWSKTGYSEVIRRNINSIENPSIKIKDNISPVDYIHEINSADLFLSCSREESMGLVMMEAIYCGVPVLATDSGGSSIIINEDNGKICFELRPETLASEIRNLVQDQSRFDQKIMRRSIEKFDSQLEFQKLADILSKI
jgi:glycosyltransferase involved in cell wall biosynthesis